MSSLPSHQSGHPAPVLILALAVMLIGHLAWASDSACLAQKLKAQDQDELSLGKLDAFAVMDVHSGRVVWWANSRILAQHSFQPASLFKVLTAYTAMGQGAVSLRKTYDCHGWQERVGHGAREVRCWLKAGHGKVNLAKALAYSCNLYFADLALKLNAADILTTARDFGLGRCTGSDFPGEICGSIPAQATREDAGRMAIGQGERFKVTPLQVLSLIGAIANGGSLLSPMREARGSSPGALRGNVENTSALRFVRHSLEEASTFGTGSVQKLHKLRVAGKTGTAAWPEVHWRTHGWYMGFWPMRRPQLAIVAFVHKGTGAGKAAALARRVMEKTIQASRTCLAAQKTGEKNP